MLEAIRQALRDELAGDDKVVLLGQDIGDFGGAFKVTQGLVEEFGEQRVADTPISESAMIGAAIGAAMVGLKPVVEMQFIDFLACGYNQLVNFAGKMRYRWGQGASLVVRGPCGAGVSGSAFHSQSPESTYLCVPGIKVVYPSTAEDAYGLLRSAIQDPDPVLFLEHKFLYRRIKGEVGHQPIPLGKAALRRRGEKLSVITYGASSHTAQEVAEQFGDQVEVIDLRCLQPLDEACLFESVKRTNKVLLYHEAQKTLGMGAELSARISEQLFEYLDGPVVRVAAPDSPVPFSPNLEKAWLPGAEQLAEACRRLLAY
ncbi:MAG: alpha-ketoacid dehydrogenase subunit beta [Candidatus Eremiobacteraeota bacterium]|nr:alpha-ketoacid dehydrogenase subunit beta [Candidatus Eremiobacteraeota bacterium]MCW5868704.1 alpha-ketoacid dehydrogenase subunit beta [Candidatus Eremiobacteraeota bacterium]